MISGNLRILLADDDEDDCLFFKEVLAELPLSAQLTTVHDGEQLLQSLREETAELPHAIFLDLNMPLMNGLECLNEIKKDPKLKHIHVIVFSTSYSDEVLSLLYSKGASCYIQKPIDFELLKKLVQQALSLALNEKQSPISREDFLIWSHKTVAKND